MAEWEQDKARRDYEEQMARIHNFNLDSSKMVIEMEALRGQISNLNADTLKKQADLRVLAWQTTFAGFAACAAVVAALMAFLRWYGIS